MEGLRVNYKVKLYDIEENGRCRADLDMEDPNIFISGFRMVPGTHLKGAITHMPKGMGTEWKYQGIISWPTVVGILTKEYLQDPRIKAIYEKLGKDSQDNPEESFRAAFHSVTEEEKYNIILTAPDFIKNALLVLKNGTYHVDLEQEAVEKLSHYDLDVRDIESMCSDAFDHEDFVSEARNSVRAEIDTCIGYCRSTMVDFSLPHSNYLWKNFTVREFEGGEISVAAPKSLNGTWKNKQYPWKRLCEMITAEYRRSRTEMKAAKLPEPEVPEPETLKLQTSQLSGSSDSSGKKEQYARMHNRLGRIRNAEHSAYAFVPHSILKLISMEDPGTNKIQKIILGLNDPKSGIGLFEIELVDWISRLEYSSNTMIMDLVMSGYILKGAREAITAKKMADVVNRLYKYDLIVVSRFTCVDDEGEALNEGKQSMYRIQTLGITGYNMLKALGRHPARRNPFGVLADGNTVKRHLSANQWLIYWLSHYSRDDIEDYSINTVINMRGEYWIGARIYAEVSLGTISLVAEPVRRCEDFEKDDFINELREKLLRYIDIFGNPDLLYNDRREQVVFSTRPVLNYICEDDEHMYEIARSVSNLVKEHPEQEVWFTTDIRIFNYDGAGKRFCVLNHDSQLQQIRLEEKTGLQEKQMEDLETGS